MFRQAGIRNGRGASALKEKYVIGIRGGQEVESHPRKGAVHPGWPGSVESKGLMIGSDSCCGEKYSGLHKESGSDRIHSVWNLDLGCAVRSRDEGTDGTCGGPP